MTETQVEQAPLAQPGMKWYVLRVASNKEEQVAEALQRKVKIEGLDTRVGRILVPTLKEKRLKGGHAKIVERKLYPGYVFVEMATEPDGKVFENVWFMVKETTGVGDFIGSDGKPTPMPEHDVVGMLAASAKAEEQPGLSGLDLKKGDVVKITEGSFENFEGEVESVDEKRGMVTVVLEVFGRSTPVEVEYWQLEKVS
ncbi:MAG TPA: transcription termination/antitermination protein NusG [Phycisphaerae bacterium]